MHKLDTHIIFSKIGLHSDNMPYSERTVVLTEKTISAQIINRAIDVMEYVTNIEDSGNYIEILNFKKICLVQSKN